MMLSVAGLRTGYGRIPILNGVSFAVNEGEFIGILGHNGMGKTTLLKALMGFLAATGGHVRFDGDDVTAAEPYRRARLGLGYVPQGREIFPGLTVYDNLRMGCTKQGGAGTGGVSPPQAASRPCRRRVIRRRAAAAGDRALPLRQAAPRPSRRTDGRYSALDHRRDCRDLAAAAREERPHHDPGRAESRLHRRAFAADSHHSKRHDHPGSAAGRSRRRKPRRRIYRNHHLSPIQRA